MPSGVHVKTYQRGIQRTCPYCGDVFTVRQEWQRFCSRSCRGLYHTRDRYALIKAATELLNRSQSMMQGARQEYMDKRFELLAKKGKTVSLRQS